MPERPQNPKSDARLSLYERLANDAEAGRLEDLECPKCRQAAVSVWFTHPAANTYRAWFICNDCDFHSRAQYSGRPRFFSEDRVSTELQERDLAILKQARIKKPPQRLM
jgi:hypothetical protein